MKHLKLEIAKVFYLLMFTGALIVVYVQSTSVFAYLGYEYNFVFDLRACILSIFFLLGIYLYYRIINSVTKFVFNFLILIIFIPLYVITLLNNELHPIAFIYLYISILVYYLLNKRNFILDYKVYKLNVNSYYILLVTSVIILRSEEHTSELQSRDHLVCRLLL